MRYLRADVGLKVVALLIALAALWQPLGLQAQTQKATLTTELDATTTSSHQLSFRRVFVAHDRVQDWIHDGKKYLPILASEFHEWISPPLESSAQWPLVHAVYHADIASDGSIAGQAVYDVKFVNDAVQTIHLGSHSLAIEEALWRSPNRPADWGVLLDGSANRSHSIRASEAGQLQVKWSAQASRKEAGMLEFDLTLPPARTSEWHVSLPVGWSAGKVNGILAKAAEPDAEGAAVVVHLGAQTRFQLRISNQNADNSRAPHSLWETELDYQLKASHLALEAVLVAWQEIEDSYVNLYLDQGLYVESVEWNGEPTTFQVEDDVTSGRTRLSVRKPRDAEDVAPADETDRLSIQAIAAWPSEEGMTLPLIQPDARTLISRLTVETGEGLSLQDLNTSGCRLAHIEPAENGEGVRREFVTTSDSPRLIVRRGVQAANLQWDSYAKTTIGYSRVATRWVGSARARGGTIYTALIPIRNGWSIKSVSASRLDWVRRWQVLDMPSNHTVLKVDFQQPLTDGALVELVIEADRIESVTQGGIPLNRLSFLPASAAESGVHWIDVDTANGLELQQQDWMDLLPSRVGGAFPPDLAQHVSPSTRQWRFELRQVQASNVVHVREGRVGFRSDCEIVATVQRTEVDYELSIEILPTQGELQSAVIALSDVIPPSTHWEVRDARKRVLDVRVIPLDANRAGSSDNAKLWRVELPGGVSESISLTCQVTLPRAAPTRIVLASVVDASPALGEVTVVKGASSRFGVENVGLAPMLAPSGEQNVVSRFRYDPFQVDATGTPYGLVIHETPSGEKQSAAFASLWDSVVYSNASVRVTTTIEPKSAVDEPWIVKWNAPVNNVSAYQNDTLLVAQENLSAGQEIQVVASSSSPQPIVVHYEYPVNKRVLASSIHFNLAQLSGWHGPRLVELNIPPSFQILNPQGVLERLLAAFSPLGESWRRPTMPVPLSSTFVDSEPARSMQQNRAIEEGFVRSQDLRGWNGYQFSADDIEQERVWIVAEWPFTVLSVSLIVGTVLVLCRVHIDLRRLVVVACLAAALTLVFPSALVWLPSTLVWASLLTLVLRTVVGWTQVRWTQPVATDMATATVLAGVLLVPGFSGDYRAEGAEDTEHDQGATPVYDLLIPVDAQRNRVGDTLYIPDQALKALLSRNKRDSSPRLLLAKYQVYLSDATGAEDSASAIQSWAEFFIRTTHPHAEISLALRKDDAHWLVEQATLDGIPVKGEWDESGTSVRFRVELPGYLRLRIPCDPLVQREVGELRLSLAIPPVDQAQLTILAGESVGSIDVPTARGRSAQLAVAPQREWVQLGATDRLEIVWSPKEKRLSASPLQKAEGSLDSWLFVFPSAAILEQQFRFDPGSTKVNELRIEIPAGWRLDTSRESIPNRTRDLNAEAANLSTTARISVPANTEFVRWRIVADDEPDLTQVEIPRIGISNLRLLTQRFAFSAAPILSVVEQSSVGLRPVSISQFLQDWQGTSKPIIGAYSYIDLQPEWQASFVLPLQKRVTRQASTYLVEPETLHVDYQAVSEVSQGENFEHVFILDDRLIVDDVRVFEGMRPISHNWYHNKGDSTLKVLLNSVQTGAQQIEIEAHMGIGNGQLELPRIHAPKVIAPTDQVIVHRAEQVFVTPEAAPNFVAAAEFDAAARSNQPGEVLVGEYQLDAAGELPLIVNVQPNYSHLNLEMLTSVEVFDSYCQVDVDCRLNVSEGVVSGLMLSARSIAGNIRVVGQSQTALNLLPIQGQQRFWVPLDEPVADSTTIKLTMRIDANESTRLTLPLVNVVGADSVQHFVSLKGGAQWSTTGLQPEDSSQHAWIDSTGPFFRVVASAAAVQLRPTLASPATPRISLVDCDITGTNRLWTIKCEATLIPEGSTALDVELPPDAIVREVTVNGRTAPWYWRRDQQLELPLAATSIAQQIAIDYACPKTSEKVGSDMLPKFTNAQAAISVSQTIVAVGILPEMDLILAGANRNRTPSSLALIRLANSIETLDESLPALLKISPSQREIWHEFWNRKVANDDRHLLRALGTDTELSSVVVQEWERASSLYSRFRNQLPSAGLYQDLNDPQKLRVPALGDQDANTIRVVFNGSVPENFARLARARSGALWWRYGMAAMLLIVAVVIATRRVPQNGESPHSNDSQ